MSGDPRHVEIPGSLEYTIQKGSDTEWEQEQNEIHERVMNSALAPVIKKLPDLYQEALVEMIWIAEKKTGVSIRATN